jgi:hypothetical protein
MLPACANPQPELSFMLSIFFVMSQMRAGAGRFAKLESYKKVAPPAVAISLRRGPQGF